MSHATMERRHFEIVAATLKSSQPDFSSVAQQQWRKDVFAFASALRQTNTNFNRARFLKACGVEES